MANKKYNSDAIEILDGLEAIIKRPAMYIGDIQEDGLHHLIWEIIQNSLDECINGFATTIYVEKLENNGVRITDDGRGIPVDKNNKYNEPGIKLIFERLHSGGKFSDKNYSISGGLHGLGTAIVNALSQYLKIQVFRNKQKYEIIYFNNGKIKNDLKVSPNKNNNTGTIIEFIPDYNIFKNVEINENRIIEFLKQQSFLNSSIKLYYKNYKSENYELYFSKNGLSDYFYKINSKDKKKAKPILLNKLFEDVKIDFCFGFSESEKLISFVNGIHTTNGGTHVIGCKNAITKGVNKYLKLKKRNKKMFNANDIFSSMTTILVVWLPEKKLFFEGQTKRRLGNRETGVIIEKYLQDWFLHFLTQNSKLTDNLISRFEFQQKLRILKKESELRIENKLRIKKNESLLSGKLINCYSRNRFKKELFLVEGDSAGGTAKNARDRKIQAILPLKGKILNVLKANNSEISKNKEINTIINALACNFSDKYNEGKLKFNKVIIMTDADTDGYHIQILLITFFLCYLPELIINGHLFIAQAPLYCVNYKYQKKMMRRYFWNNDYEKLIAKLKISWNIQRYKGLGEMNSDQLWETTMCPDTRHLIKIILSEKQHALSTINLLMGQNAANRKKWIKENIIFNYDYLKEIKIITKKINEI